MNDVDIAMKYVQAVAETEFKADNTDPIHGTLANLKNLHPFWQSSWYCEDCPGPKHKENFCTKHKEDDFHTLCLETNNQIDRLLELLAAHEWQQEMLDDV